MAFAKIALTNYYDMELTIYLILLYLVASILVSMEGVRHQIGGTYAFVLSLIVTPLIGIVIVCMSPRNANISHFVKRSDCKDCPYKEDSSDAVCEVCEKHAYWVEI